MIIENSPHEEDILTQWGFQITTSHEQTLMVLPLPYCHYNEWGTTPHHSSNKQDWWIFLSLMENHKIATHSTETPLIFFTSWESLRYRKQFLCVYFILLLTEHVVVYGNHLDTGYTIIETTILFLIDIYPISNKRSTRSMLFIVNFYPKLQNK